VRAALLAVGVTAVLILVWLMSRTSEPAVLVAADQLGPGEIVLAEVSFDMFVRAPDNVGGRLSKTRIEAIFITRGLEGEWHGLLTKGPLRGCRLQVVGFPGDEVRFLDPCDGGRYAIDGAVIEAPSTRGLTDVPLIVTDEGVKIDTARLG
jgi:hypothetical protein